MDMQLNQWFQTPIGKSLLDSEQAMFTQVLPGFLGDSLLQLGGPPDESVMSASPMLHKLYLTNSLSALPTKDYPAQRICAHYNEIPLASHSIDLAILYHVIEFEPAPLEVFSEIFRVLKGEGQVMVLAFHAMSFWGIQQLWHRNGLPWQAHFYSTFRLERWLQQVGFVKEKHKTLYFRPYFANEKINKQLLFLEPLGQLCWPYCGAVSVLTAKKSETTANLLLDEDFESSLVT